MTNNESPNYSLAALVFIASVIGAGGVAHLVSVSETRGLQDQVTHNSRELAERLPRIEAIEGDVRYVREEIDETAPKDVKQVLVHDVLPAIQQIGRRFDVDVVDIVRRLEQLEQSATFDRWHKKEQKEFAELNGLDMPPEKGPAND